MLLNIWFNTSEKYLKNIRTYLGKKNSKNVMSHIIMSNCISKIKIELRVIDFCYIQRKLQRSVGYRWNSIYLTYNL